MRDDNKTKKQLIDELAELRKKFSGAEATGGTSMPAGKDLKAQSARNELILRTTHDGFWVVGLDGNLLEVNDAYCEMVGYSRDELLSMNVADLEANEDPEEVKSHIEKILREGEDRFEARHRRKDGNLIDLQANVKLAESGGESFLFTFLKDITEHKRAEEELLLRSEIISRMTEGVYLVRMDGIIVYTNPKFEQMFGYEPGEMIGRHASIVNYPTEKKPEETAREILEVLDKTGVWLGEIQNVRKDGTPFWSYASVVVFDHSKHGKVLVAVHSDITERKRAEESLRKAKDELEVRVEERTKELSDEIAERKQTEEEITSLGRILEHSLNEIYIFDAQNFKFILVNEGARRNLGFSMEELRNFTPLYIKPEYTYEDFKALIEPLKTGEVDGVKFTTVHKRKDASLYPVEVYLQLSTFGSVPAFIAIILDITERKRAEDQIRLHHEMVGNMAEGTALVSASDGTIVNVNQRFEEMFGYSSGELLGENVSILNAPATNGNTPEEVHGEIAEALDRDGMWSGEVKNIKKDGTIFWCRANVTIFKSTQYGEVWLGVMEDINDKKRAEEDRLKAQKLESVGVLAGGIAHDFNNIITGILGNISLAKIYSSPEGKAFERLVEAENAVEHATRLAQQLLTFSKGGKPVKEAAYLRNLIKDSVSFSLSGSNIRCEYSIREDLWPVDLDTGQINQVFSNLTINARYAMPEGGLLKVGAENITTGTDYEDAIKGLLKEGQYIKITVTDNGTGIGTEHLDKIFDPYFSTKEGGSGLGLATSYSIIKKHDGHITVESQPGAGTTFHIYLPASKELPVDKGRGELTTSLMERKQKGMKVLVMDDEEVIRDVSGEMLTSLGYEVNFATDGNEAIELYRKAKESGEPFDVVIMDLTIPGGMGGKEAIKKLLEVDPGAKVIVSSGYFNDPVMSNYKNYGFRNVIAKPYKFAELSAKVHKVIAGEE